ncbi:hypothetical protein BGZ80_008727 [Entomortierella chlamydospora]|uniref:Uncharacterized protein n=1 Tax=Entomortierella chlamydospora TaxID=101097 RepID=A0A9P6T1H3_9FUNG|nr:hypothetical protein BGZ80_008727 [Entomortierella chlamydospora]
MKTKQWAKKLFRSASSKSSSNPSTVTPSISNTTNKSLNPKSTSSSLSSQFYSHSTSSVSSVLTVKKQSIRKIFCHVDGNGSVNSLMSLTFKPNSEQDVRSDSPHYDVNGSATTSSSSKNELVIPASSQEQLMTTTLYYYPPPNKNEMDFVPKPKFHQEHLCQKEKETLTKSKQDITMMDQPPTSESETQCSGQYRQLKPSSDNQMPPKRTVCGPDELALPTALHCNTSTALDYPIQCENLDPARKDFTDDSIRIVPTKSAMRSQSCIGLNAARSLDYESQANRGHDTRRNLAVLNAGPSGHPNVAPSMSQDRGGHSESIDCSVPYSEISRQNAPTPPPPPLRPARPDEDLCHVLKHIELDTARFEWPELFTRGITSSGAGDQIMRI